MWVRVSRPGPSHATDFQIELLDTIHSGTVPLIAHASNWNDSNAVANNGKIAHVAIVHGDNGICKSIMKLPK